MRITADFGTFRDIIYRLDGPSRPEARQLVKHGHFAVNGRKVNVRPTVRPGTSFCGESSKHKGRFKELAELHATRVPWNGWKLMRKPDQSHSLAGREEIDSPIAEHLIVELYSR